MTPTGAVVRTLARLLACAALVALGAGAGARPASVPASGDVATNVSPAAPSDHAPSLVAWTGLPTGGIRLERERGTLDADRLVRPLTRGRTQGSAPAVRPAESRAQPRSRATPSWYAALAYARAGLLSAPAHAPPIV